jgi:hypothetical protein
VKDATKVTETLRMFGLVHKTKEFSEPDFDGFYPWSWVWLGTKIKAQ